MCACMRVCMRVRVCVCVCVLARACVCACMRACAMCEEESSGMPQYRSLFLEYWLWLPLSLKALLVRPF